MKLFLVSPFEAEKSVTRSHLSGTACHRVTPTYGVHGKLRMPLRTSISNTEIKIERCSPSPNAPANIFALLHLPILNKFPAQPLFSNVATRGGKSPLTIDYFVEVENYREEKERRRVVSRCFKITRKIFVYYYL